MSFEDLPHIDEHALVVAADVGEVWRVLLGEVDRAFVRTGSGAVARLMGCAQRSADGPRPLREGSTIPGFQVSTAVPGAELVLSGRHRFSVYALTFRLDPAGPGRTRLCAVTRARFPGVTGRVYRALVIGSRGHVFVVRRFLAGVARRAERERAGGESPPALP